MQPGRGVDGKDFACSSAPQKLDAGRPHVQTENAYGAGKAAKVRNNLGEKAAAPTAEVCQGKTIPVSSCLIPPPESGSQPEPCCQTIGDFPDGYITPRRHSSGSVVQIIQFRAFHSLLALLPSPPPLLPRPTHPARPPVH